VIELGPPALASSVSKILCLGAHADDIEIGCGGFLLRLLQMNPAVAVTWVVFAGGNGRDSEARLSAERLLEGAASVKIIVKDFRDGYFPYAGTEVKEEFDALGRNLAPDLVLTHCRHDMHQDHRLLCELTWNTFRDHFILEYEIPKYDGDLASPNVFVQLDAATCERKIGHLMEAFPSQRCKPWFTEETFWATLRLRGLECRSRTGFAEGFFCRKLVLA
jgi:LmbE family N-acetylglucosaminyl deacetylase